MIYSVLARGWERADAVLARGWERADVLLILYLEFFSNRIKRATNLAFRNKFVKAPFISV